MAGSNNAPKLKWFSAPMACGTVRQRLYVNGVETPYFIDSSDRLGHRTSGSKHGLFGSGVLWSARLGYGIAKEFDSGSKLALLKHRAEQMALSAP